MADETNRQGWTVHQARTAMVFASITVDRADEFPGSGTVLDGSDGSAWLVTGYRSTYPLPSGKQALVLELRAVDAGFAEVWPCAWVPDRVATELIGVTLTPRAK